MINEDYADELALRANISGQAESVLQSLDQATRDIDFDVKADTT